MFDNKIENTMMLYMNSVKEADALYNISTVEELEFAIFCVENVATKLEIDAQQVYRMLSEDSDILNSYIVSEYEMLHTQSKEYIVEDIIDFMRESGVVR